MTIVFFSGLLDAVRRVCLFWCQGSLKSKRGPLAHMWTPRPNGSVIASNAPPISPAPLWVPEGHQRTVCVGAGGVGVRRGAFAGAFRPTFMVFARLLVQITSSGVRKCRPPGKTRLTSEIAGVFSFWALMYSWSPPSK